MPDKPERTRGAPLVRESARSADGAGSQAGGAGGKARPGSGAVRGGLGKTGAVGTLEGRESPAAQYAEYTLRAIEKDLWKMRESLASMTTREFLFSQGQACIYVSDDKTEIITENPEGRVVAEARHPKAIAASRRPYTPPAGSHTVEELFRMIRDEAPKLEEIELPEHERKVRVVREAVKA